MVGRGAMSIGMNDTPEGVEATAAQAAQTDEQLMVAFVRGSRDAFDELFLRYKQPLYGFFRRRIGDLSAAEELTQETFLAVLRASSRYEACALFRTYLYAVAFRMLRAHRRKRAFRAMFWKPLDDQREPASGTALETEIAIRDALRKLDSTEREVLMLREYEQLSYAEIAEILNLPINTVRTRLFRSRGALRELLTAKAPQVAGGEMLHSEERA